jgi:hypothetical protein
LIEAAVGGRLADDSGNGFDAATSSRAPLLAS